MNANTSWMAANKIKDIDVNRIFAICLANLDLFRSYNNYVILFPNEAHPTDVDVFNTS